MKCIVFVFMTFLISNIANGQEIIPFNLKDDNRMYVQGKINSSDTLDLVFDLGANTTVINKTRMETKNVQIKFDTVVLNKGGNGISKEDKSLRNQVLVGKYNYEGVDILGIAYPEADILDGLIGWNFFENKIIQLNFESTELIIHDQLPTLSDQYSKCKIKFISGLPYIETIIYKGRKKVKIWAMLDTGYNSTFKVYYNTVINNKLDNEFLLIGESISYGTDGTIAESDLVLLPKISLGDFEVYNMPADLVKTKVESDIPALFGGNLLKRFHVFLDFNKKLAYLKPNIYINSKF
ncbi:Aspartyl protease [Marivirga sericea]|uniref:Aspartyl protease n=1 Tax=Marivirga sericea TaxID=1028 RepID=A0A1X7K678_9BACT|nr:aspartyl protease family protein [Marivirga sericea]SMG36252.1 Aspartyl protease [Marivirga sericea]